MFFFKKLAGVSGRHLGRYPVITISPKAPDHRLDLVRQNFRAQAPGKRWAAEITYVRTLPRCSYTAFVVDVFSRKIAGVTTRSTVRSDVLPIKAVEHALTATGQIHRNQLVHHSDRASQRPLQSETKPSTLQYKLFDYFSRLVENGCSQ